MARANVPDTSSGEQEPERYDKSDLEHLWRVRAWRNWDEVLDWLRTEGDRDNAFTPGGVTAIAADFDRARSEGRKFPRSADEAARITSGH